MITMNRIIKCLCVAALCVQVFAPHAASAGNTKLQKMKPANAQMLRSISPRKGRVVPRRSILKAPGGTVALTCCTHWNSQTGGTGCATYDDSEGSCPSNTFQVECGSGGCW